jgi:hypothetical protein
VSVIRKVSDFRKPRGRRYELGLLLFCIFLTELKNCRRQRQRAIWIKGNWAWISNLWKDSSDNAVPRKSPSQSSISRVLDRLDLWALIEQYHAAVRASEEKKSEKTDPSLFQNHYAIDGKSRAGCVSAQTGRTEIDVTIFNVRSRQVIAIRTLPDKKGESTSARSILKKIGRKIPRGIFTGDAGYSHPKFTESVISAGHEYLLGVKKNAGHAYDVCCAMSWDKAAVIHTTHNNKHGRKETRRLKRIALTRSTGREFKKYKKCSYLFCVESEITKSNKTTYETRYFIGSQGLQGTTSPCLLNFIRSHWLQENGLHWVKDKVLGEDLLPKMSNRSSRVLGFLKDIVVSIGYLLFKSVQRFVDEFDASPESTARALIFSG